MRINYCYNTQIKDFAYDQPRTRGCHIVYVLALCSPASQILNGAPYTQAPLGGAAPCPHQVIRDNLKRNSSQNSSWYTANVPAAKSFNAQHFWSVARWRIKLTRRSCSETKFQRTTWRGLRPPSLAHAATCLSRHTGDDARRDQRQEWGISKQTRTSDARSNGGQSQLIQGRGPSGTSKKKREPPILGAMGIQGGGPVLGLQRRLIF